MTAAAPRPGIATPRIGVIGCGAIARTFHIPSLVRHPELVPGMILVDRDLSRARTVAAEFGLTRTADNYAAILGDVDAVVVTVPHQLHYRISMDCLRAGKHVLCEKPLAESPTEARALIDAAAGAGVTLSVNHKRRLFPVSRRIKELVDAGAIGPLRHIEFLWGEEFDWPVQNGFYFGVGGAPHGVLMDKGPHALDLICWWLGGKPDVLSCRDDSFGGGEAMMSLRLARGPCTVTAEFSFLSRYANTCTLEGERGRIAANLFEFSSFTLVSPGGERTVVKLETPARSMDDFGPLMLDNFVSVLRGREAPLIPATDILDSVTLIDECYARRQRYDMPWHDAWKRVIHD